MVTYREYLRKFRKRSTESLIRDYHKFNADFRGMARDEFRKRRVPVAKLPFKRRVVKRSVSPMMVVPRMKF